MPFLSVIIPVYNVEKYLHRCVDSVLQQDLDDIEIILVDDGSPDNCPRICDEYHERYGEIRVIHKNNDGLSSARNAGLDIAEGQYTIFMDSDDWWNKDVDVKQIMNMLRKKNDIEMFLFTSYDFIGGHGLYKRKEHQNLVSIKTNSTINYYWSLLKNGNLEVSACTKILKTDFLKKNNLYFKTGILSEDNEWMLRVLRVLKKVEVIDEPLYICMFDRQDSITHSIKKKNVEDLLSIVEESIVYYRKNNSKPELKKCELCYASYLWFSALGLSTRLSEQERKELKAKFKETNEVCQYSMSKKTKLCNRLYSVFGMEITTKILGRYIDLKGKHIISRIKIQ